MASDGVIGFPLSPNVNAVFLDDECSELRWNSSKEELGDVYIIMSSWRKLPVKGAD